MPLKKIDSLTPEDIASICDHTFLDRPEAYRGRAQKGQSPVRLWEEEFDRFMESVVGSSLAPYAVCVRHENVAYVKEYLKGHGRQSVLVASVVGFPGGKTYSTGFKVDETKLAIEYGADEIDMVLNYDMLKKGRLDDAKKDVAAVTETAHQYGKPIKLIFETSELDHEQIKQACRIAEECRVDFIKTSTGFSSSGAKAEDLKIMRGYFSGGIKISGGVNAGNVKELLYAASGRDDGYIELDPLKIRIGESSLLQKLLSSIKIKRS